MSKSWNATLISNPTPIERPRALAQDDRRIGDLVECDGPDRRDFVEADPDIGKNDNDQRGQVEQENQPGVAQPVGHTIAPHDEADDRADRHRQDKGRSDAQQSDAEIEEERARLGFERQTAQDVDRRRQLAGPRDVGSDLPAREEYADRDEAPHDPLTPAAELVVGSGVELRGGADEV